MRYFTRADEDELVKLVSEQPDRCVIVREEMYRVDNNAVVYRESRPIFLHRLLYNRVFGGRLLRSQFLIRECDEPRCVNPMPRHRTLSDRPVRGQPDHCKNGHPYPALPARDQRGSRQCLECKKARYQGTGQGSPTKATIGDRNRQKAFCPRGHEYSPENTRLYTGKDGHTRRYCIACTEERRADTRVRPVR
jgi:hypothetical protein